MKGEIFMVDGKWVNFEEQAIRIERRELKARREILRRKRSSEAAGLRRKYFAPFTAGFDGRKYWGC